MSESDLAPLELFDPSEVDLSIHAEDIAARIKEVIDGLKDEATWIDFGDALRERFEGNEPLVDLNPDKTESTAPVPRTAADWYPGATRKFISGKVRSRGTSKADMAVLHIAAGDSSSLYSWFSHYLRGVSHFYVLTNGKVEQYVPISSKSGSELNGNHHCISFETQGGSSSTKDRPWTDAQVNTIAEILAWLNKQWGLTLTMATRSYASSKGVGYHRLGIDGNFPSSGIYAGRRQRGGGQLWSAAYGKTCPENYAQPATSKSRIAQIDDIIAKAKGSDGGSGSGGGGSKPRIDVDGFWGRDTTSLAQEVFGTPIDGEVWSQSNYWKDRNKGLTFGWVWVTPSKSKGSPLIEAMQKHCNEKDKAGLDEDGKIGTETIKAFQRRLTKMGYYKGPIDGSMDYESTTVMALQRALNDGVK